MTIAFTFPGQGSQAVGMGRDLAEAFPAARAVFEEVDEALGEKLSSLIWEGPEDALTLTANAQPALMAVSLAVIRAMEAQGFSLKGTVSYVAGHSLGEYSALAAAGTLTIADAARLLRIRGNAMQKAVPVGEGAMAAILGLEQSSVEKACAEFAQGSVCQIANDNGGGQLVISGSKSAVERAAGICTDMGAKRAIMLPVSAPFHSALMAPAAEAMREALSQVELRVPSVPVVANVIVQPTTDPAEISRRLVEQVTGRVRWRETIEWLAIKGATTLYEVGAGKVLSGLARRISRDLATSTVGSPAEVEAALAALR
ncbi:ACP S-malonyltransferase [Pseudaminobacter sp. 19-2017]|uniref:Malonyl CoA-acyl carrier protein transacylase n=1 Tax=Pseudaminobacter soli (ex Zhang et al. 2022) TaxID=2831468 RepID=A0A942E4X8_9HYPH|nr:ACP S-malonyltransferase [Pseudaminobacter soli]MBS3650625.1 ACP S-malonyltransferase [Pseudaminobacter soli]